MGAMLKYPSGVGRGENVVSIHRMRTFSSAKINSYLFKFVTTTTQFGLKGSRLQQGLMNVNLG